MRELCLPLPPYPWRFDLLLQFVKRIAYPARMLAQDDTLWRYIEGQLLSYQGTGDAIIVRGAALSASTEAQVRRASMRWLGLCRDLTDFYTFARADSELWQIIEPLQGLPIFGTETVFEALITLIIEQHITWKTAMRSQRSLMQIFGEGANVLAGRVYDFPHCQELAAAESEALKVLKITNRRIALIIDIARAVCHGELDLESMRHLSPSEAYKRLMEIKGVGHWTASNVIGRALGEYPFVSHNDVALQAAVRHYFHADKGEKSASQVIETLGKYGEYAGLAGHFLLLRWVLDHYPALQP